MASFSTLPSLVLVAALPVLALSACSRCDLAAVDYGPLARSDWAVSTPEAQGLDRSKVDALYCDAQGEDTLYGVLVVKDGHLVAEQYFNGADVDQLDRRASVTKSYTSALVGIALEQGCLSSLDAKLLDFFPEVTVTDPRKEQITVRQMLQMRAGYPWEESDAAYWDAMLSGDYVPLIDAFPLIADPGTTHQYSNLTSNWLGKIVTRACETDLWTFGETHLFGPTDTSIGEWQQDVDGDYIGCGDLQVTARDMARFGQLYLDEGSYQGKQVVPQAWVRESLRSYSDDPHLAFEHRDLDDWGYGYQWWMGEAGDHHVSFAYGHGGNFIFLVHDLDLVLVITADPFWLQTGGASWRHEKAHLKLATRFLASLSE